MKERLKLMTTEYGLPYPTILFDRLIWQKSDRDKY
jgi:hypothetical protein